MGQQKKSKLFPCESITLGRNPPAETHASDSETLKL